MKLYLIFGDRGMSINWDRDVSEFPNLVTYDNKYWEMISWDKDLSSICDYNLFFGETKQSVVPIDMYGNQFPVPNINEMFGSQTVPGGPCQCGAKFTSFPDNHMILCPKWSKQ